jgi:uncharacterized membrane protein
MPQMKNKDRFPVLLSYLGFLGIFPPYLAYFVLAETDYARFHARQGIYLTVFFLAGAVILGIGRFLFLYTQIVSTQVIWLGYMLLFFFYVCLNLLGAIKALNDKLWEIPLVGRLARQQQET